MSNKYDEVLAAVCDAKQAAIILNVSPERAKVFCREGRIAAKRIGRDWVIVVAAVEELAQIERHSGPREYWPKPRKMRRKKKGKKSR